MSCLLVISVPFFVWYPCQGCMNTQSWIWNQDFVHNFTRLLLTYYLFWKHHALNNHSSIVCFWLVARLCWTLPYWHSMIWIFKHLSSHWYDQQHSVCHSFVSFWFIFPSSEVCWQDICEHSAFGHGRHVQNEYTEWKLQNFWDCHIFYLHFKLVSFLSYLVESRNQAGKWPIHHWILSPAWSFELELARYILWHPSWNFVCGFVFCKDGCIAVQIVWVTECFVLAPYRTDLLTVSTVRYQVPNEATSGRVTDWPLWYVLQGFYCCMASCRMSPHKENLSSHFPSCVPLCSFLCPSVLVYARVLFLRAWNSLHCSCNLGFLLSACIEHPLLVSWSLRSLCHRKHFLSFLLPFEAASPSSMTTASLACSLFIPCSHWFPPSIPLKALLHCNFLWSRWSV